VESGKEEAAKKEKALEFESVRARTLLKEAESVYQEFMRAGNREEAREAKEGARQRVHTTTELPGTGSVTS
jgi:hypothetical protein